MCTKASTVKLQCELHNVKQKHKCLKPENISVQWWTTTLKIHFHNYKNIHVLPRSSALIRQCWTKLLWRNSTNSLIDLFTFFKLNLNSNNFDLQWGKFMHFIQCFQLSTQSMIIAFAYQSRCIVPPKRDIHQSRRWYMKKLIYLSSNVFYSSMS